MIVSGSRPPSVSVTIPDTRDDKWEACQRVFQRELDSIIGIEDMPLRRWTGWDDDYYMRSCSDDEGKDEEGPRKMGKKERYSIHKHLNCSPHVCYAGTASETMTQGS